MEKKKQKILKATAGVGILAAIITPPVVISQNKKEVIKEVPIEKIITKTQTILKPVEVIKEVQTIKEVKNPINDKLKEELENQKRINNNNLETFNFEKDQFKKILDKKDLDLRIEKQKNKALNFQNKKLDEQLGQEKAQRQNNNNYLKSKLKKAKYYFFQKGKHTKKTFTQANRKWKSEHFKIKIKDQ